MSKPTNRILNLPVEVYEKYETAARQVAQASPLMQAVPLPKLTQILLQVELDRGSARDIAKRFIRNIVRQVRLGEPTEPKQSTPPALPSAGVSSAS